MFAERFTRILICAAVTALAAESAGAWPYQIRLHVSGVGAIARPRFTRRNDS